ncbi:MAG TPA: hypothetical protein VK796_03645 [Cytophaga sp.]|jgi:hypothetical protein|nr:hypothetical protein [Cytophaga sp.]
MKDVVCTLFEGNYHYGVAGLINSLAQHGFNGIIYAGCKENEPLPDWAICTSKEGYEEMSVTPEIQVRFIRVSTEYHFTNYKPHFMLQMMEREVGHDNFFYFDPDIVIVQSWKLFAQWVQFGVAMCQDVNFHMPATHVFKLRWLEYAEQNGFKKTRAVEGFCNGGFVGVHRKNAVFLENWKKIMDISIADNLTNSKASWNKKAEYAQLFSRTEDQDLQNLSIMISDCPISIVGPDAMGFTFGKRFMFHSLGQPKAWNLTWKHVFQKSKISESNMRFYKYVNTPINISQLLGLKMKMILLSNRLKK